jgi:hypothetical protein
MDSIVLVHVNQIAPYLTLSNFQYATIDFNGNHIFKDG